MGSHTARRFEAAFTTRARFRRMGRGVVLLALGIVVGGCGPGEVHEGDVALGSRRQIDAFLGKYTEVRGDLTIRVIDGRKTLRLDGLERVTGTLSIGGNDHLEELFFPDLREVGGLGVGGNPRLVTLEFPELEVVGDELSPVEPSVRAWDLVVSADDRLRRLRFPRLSRVKKLRLEATGGRTFEELSFPALTSIVELEMSGDVVSSFVLPALTRAREITIQGIETLRAVSFPELQELDDSLFVSSSGARALEEISLPKLERAHRVDVSSWNSATKVDLSSLRAVNELLRHGTPPRELNDNVEPSSWLLPRLERVGVLLVYDASLSSLELPSLTWAGKVIAAGDRMRSLAIDRLTEVGELQVSASELTTLQAPALRRAEKLVVLVAPVRSLRFPVLEELRRLELVETHDLPACPLSFYFPRVNFDDVLVFAPPATCTCSLVDEAIEATCE